MPNASRLLPFVSVFGAGKLLVFLAPLVASSTLALASYGVLEWALAVATMLVPLVTLGLTAAAPYFILHKKVPEIAESFKSYGGALVLTGGIGLVGAAALGEIPAALVIGATAAFAVQFILSSIAKSRGELIHSSLYDTGFYFFLLVAALTPSHVGGDLLPYVVGVLAYLLILLSRMLGGLRHYSSAHLRTAVKYGAAMIYPTFAMLCLIAGGRAVGGYLLSEDEMGMFGILFRVTAPAVLAHQLITTFMFPRMYAEADGRTLDKYYVVVITGVALLAGAGAVVVPTLLRPFLPAFDAAMRHDQFWSAYFWLSIQTVLWAGLALLESLMARENLAKAQSTILTAGFVVLVLAAAAIEAWRGIDVAGIIGIQALVCGVALLATIRRLRQAGIVLRWSRWVALALLGLLPAGFFLP